MPGTRISDYDRGRVIGRYLSGQTISNIAEIEDRPHQTISNIIIRDIQPDGHLIPPTPPTGRPRTIRSPTRRLVLNQNRHTTINTWRMIITSLDNLYTLLRPLQT